MEHVSAESSAGCAISARLYPRDCLADERRWSRLLCSTIFATTTLTHADFVQFMSQKGTAAMARWWNRMPQYDGLFDYQNTMRPSYFAFKLLSRLGGDRLSFESSDGSVHGFATYDPEYHSYNLLLWNFSDKPVDVSVAIEGLPGRYRAERRSLDATTISNDENARLRPLGVLPLSERTANGQTSLQPYGIEYWSIEEVTRQKRSAFGLCMHSCEGCIQQSWERT